MKITPVFLLLAVLSPFAHAATFRLTIENTINWVSERDENSDMVDGPISTPYGTIAAGSNVTITLTYDLDDFTQVGGPQWSGGSGIYYQLSNKVAASITVSSGYSYTGTLDGGVGYRDVEFFNQITAHDQVNFNCSTGIFLQLSDYSGSTTFTTNPIQSDSLQTIHDNFMAGVNAGLMKPSNGGPSGYAVPTNAGKELSISWGIPSSVNISPVSAVPEPGGLLLGAVGWLGLAVRRRRNG